MLAGNVCAQAIAFIASPVLTRLYTPQDFGAATVIISAVAVLSVFASFRYEPAIVMARNRQEGLSIVALSLLLCTVFTILLSVVVCFFRYPLAQFGKLQGREMLLWLIPAGVFTFSVLQTTSFWFTREKAFSLLSLNQVIIQVTTVPIKIGAAILWFLCLLANVWYYYRPVCSLNSPVGPASKRYF
jgi:O-antigen/teichoic acid export membrane protein